MPKLKKPIPESDQLVVRAIALGVIQEVLIDRMGLSPDIRITFPGYSEVVAQPKGLISSKNEDIRLPTSDKLNIEVTENYVTDWLPAMVTNAPEQIPLFLNRDLELEMRPIYASVEMRINIIYRAKDKTDARRFYDLMAMKVPDREDTWLHTLKYSYGLPDAFVAILQEIHRLTELTAGYGDDFNTFFAKWANPRYGYLTDQAGKNTMGVFSETQSRVLGYFDFPEVPDFGAKKDQTEAWDIEIPYVIRYEKPKDVSFSYPIVIHNSVLSSKYRGKAGMQRVEDFQQSRTWSLAHFKSFEASESLKRPYNDFPGRYFPLFDEFMPRHIPPKTMRVFTTLVLLPPDDAEDPLLLMNIGDLEDPQYGMRLNDCIKNFMISEREYITTPRQSAIHLGLYMGRHLMDGSYIEMDENLNIRSTKPLNKRNYYHLRLSIVTDLTYLVPDAQERLRMNPCTFSNVLEYIMPENAILPVPQVVVDRVTRASFNAIANWLRGNPTGFPPGPSHMLTVQNSKMNAVYNVKR